jgi:hypothetical protein
MWLLSGRGALRLCMMVLFVSGTAGGSGELFAADLSSPQLQPVEATDPMDGVHFGGVNESTADAFRPRIRDLKGQSMTESLNGDHLNDTFTPDAGRIAGPPAAIPLPAPVFLGLTGFAFMVSVKFVKRFFF